MPRLRVIPLALLMPVAAARAQDAPEVIVDANIPPARLWTHHLTFPESIDGVRSIAFAPDRDSIYVHYAVNVIDVWSLLVHYWPEVLGGVLALSTLLLLLIVRRVLRRKQTPGAPHCRKCNYDLTPQVRRDARNRFTTHPDARCPECGVLIARKRPVRGRRALVRLVPELATILVLAPGYATLLVSDLPRDGRASKWLDWSSSDLAAFAATNRLLNHEVKEGIRVVRVGLKTASVDRSITTRRGQVYSPIAVTPDGRGIIIENDTLGGPLFRAIDSTSGRSLAELAFSRPQPSYVGFAPLELSLRRGVIGFITDEHEVLVQHSAGLSAWNLQSGRARPLLTNPSLSQLLAPNTNPRRLFSLARQGAIREWSIAAFDPPGKLTNLGLTFALPLSAALCDTGERLVVVSESHTLIQVVDMQSSPHVRLLSAGTSRAFHSSVALNKDGSILVACSFDGNVLVRDLNRAAWVGQLSLPAETYAADSSISNDNHWIAASVQTGDGRATPYRHDLVLWNLAEILATSEQPQPTTDAP